MQPKVRTRLGVTSNYLNLLSLSIPRNLHSLQTGEGVYRSQRWLVGGVLRRVEGLARRRRQLSVVRRLDVLALGVPPSGAVAHPAALLDEMGLHHLTGIVIDGPRPDEALGDRPPGHQDLVALLGVALLHLEQSESGEIDRQIFPGLVVLGDDGAAHRQHADSGDEVALVRQLLFGHRRRERERRGGKEGEQQVNRGTKHVNSSWPGRRRVTTLWTGRSSGANPKLLACPGQGPHN